MIGDAAAARQAAVDVGAAVGVEHRTSPSRAAAGRWRTRSRARRDLGCSRSRCEPVIQTCGMRLSASGRGQTLTARLWVNRPSKLNGPSWRRPRLDDEIDAFPQALDGLRRVGIGGEDLVGHAAHEADIEAAARDAVDHRHFLGDADRIAAVGDRIAENADAALARLARENRGRSAARTRRCRSRSGDAR